MSHGGGGQPSCASVSLGKALRRALRKRINGGGKPARRKRPAAVSDSGGGGEVRVSKELATCSSSLRTAEPAVRVVLPSGVVEAYSGVVLACTVIRNHPPGLCLAYPDVFRNPHAARVRPLEPLLPGQKFYLLPEKTMTRLQREIAESSVSAFDDDKEKEEVCGDDGGEDDVTSSTETTTTTTEEEEEDCNCGDDDGGDCECGGRRWCCAREYFEEKERWEECQFKQMVARGLAVEKEAAAAATKKKKTKKKRKMKRSIGGMEATGCRTVRLAATARRTWEPSLPSVEEESSPLLHPPSETTSCCSG